MEGSIMARTGSLFVAAIALFLLGACQAEQPASPGLVAAVPAAAASSAATATASSNPAPPTGDPCGDWLSEVKAICTAFVEGREVAGDCASQSITVRTSFDLPEMQDPKIGPAVCSTHLKQMQRNSASATPRPAVVLGEECAAFAAKVKSECIDTLGMPGDAMTCNAKLSMIGTARNADAEQRESSCQMGRLIYAN
jgi:hypothetical protein